VEYPVLHILPSSSTLLSILVQPMEKDDHDYNEEEGEEGEEGGCEEGVEEREDDENLMKDND